MSFQPNKLSKRNRTEANLLSVWYLFCKNGAPGAAVSTVQGLGDQGSRLAVQWSGPSAAAWGRCSLQSFLISITVRCRSLPLSEVVPSSIVCPTGGHHGGGLLFPFQSCWVRKSLLFWFAPFQKGELSLPRQFLCLAFWDATLPGRGYCGGLSLEWWCWVTGECKSSCGGQEQADSHYPTSLAPTQTSEPFFIFWDRISL